MKTFPSPLPPPLRLDGQIPPFRIFDRETAEATGEHDDGYFASRELFGEPRAKNEDGTIRTLDDAVGIRERMARGYKCHHKTLEIHDATGTAVCETFLTDELMRQIDWLSKRLNPEAEKRLLSKLNTDVKAYMADLYNLAAAKRGSSVCIRVYPDGYLPGDMLAEERQPEEAAMVAAWVAQHAA